MPEILTDAYLLFTFVFKQALKALTGESANEFIRRMRMNNAMELLKTGSYSLSEVSVMVGYSTASYFSTSFKKFFGEHPSEYVKTDIRT